MDRFDLMLGIEEFFELVADTIDRKNHDYTGADESVFDNFEFVEREGITDTTTGMLVRLSDKYKRLISLTSRIDQSQVEESIDDTLMDMAGYVALLAVYLKSRKQTPPTGATSTWEIPS
jgi:uncharacterized protein YutE (UPF0331/DUF86 family)